jgi:metallo-beta-lactamase class B
MRSTLSLLLAASLTMIATQAGAQLQAPGASSPETASVPQPHFSKARAYAAQELGWRHPGLVNCYRYEGGASQGLLKDPLPTRAFDNLYYVGNGKFGPWVIKTSEGLILIDAMNNSFDVDKYIIPGLKTLGLDPNQLKVLIISHGHPDHYGGAKYLQDKYHVKTYEAEADYTWSDMISKDPREAKGFGPAPRHDQIIKDGDTVTLGDESIKMYISPGHTPASLSMLIPVKDHGTPRLIAYIGGITSRGLSPALHVAFDKSSQRLQTILTKAKVAGYIAPHANYDDSIYKFELLNSFPNRTNPFLIGTDQTVLFLKVVNECNLNNAQIEASGSKEGDFSPSQPPDSLIPKLPD